MWTLMRFEPVFFRSRVKSYVWVFKCGSLSANNIVHCTSWPRWLSCNLIYFSRIPFLPVIQLACQHDQWSLKFSSFAWKWSISSRGCSPKSWTKWSKTSEDIILQEQGRYVDEIAKCRLKWSRITRECYRWNVFSLWAQSF